MSSRTGIILVHGIGDQSQRATLQAFISTLTKMGLTSKNKQHILREPGTADKDFSYFLTETSIAGKSYKIAEYHWADLSRSKTGFGAKLYNFYQLISNAPYLIYACLGPDVSGDKNQDPIILRCLRAFQALTFWLIYYPIIAVNASFAILVTGFALHAKYNGKTPELHDPIDVTYAVTSACAIILLFMMRYFSRPGHIRRIITLMIVLLSIVASYVFIKLFGYGNPVTFEISRKYANAIAYAFWILAIAGSIPYFLLLLPPFILPYKNRWRGLLLGFAVTFLVIAFWALLTITLWLALLNTIFDSNDYKRLLPEIGQSLGFVGMFAFDILFLFVLFSIYFVLYYWKSISNKDRVTGRMYPRLIVPAAIPVVCWALFGLLIWVMWNCSCTFSGQNCDGSDCPLLTWASTKIIWNAALLITVGSIFANFASIPIDVASDIVNYFKSDKGHQQPNPLKAISSVFRRSRGEPNEFRLALQNRLTALIEDLNNDFGPFDKFVIVSHSLGSIIGLDTLVHLKENGKISGDWTLITMGSPYKLIFRNYFPHLFRPAGLDLLPASSSWTNIYRENDYVGTMVTNGEAGVREIAQPPLGHTCYFSDPEVLQHVLAIITDDANSAAVE